MKRRAFMLSVGGAAAGMVLLPRLAFAEAGKIDWYTSSDTNILDFWTNIVKPKFEAANPGVTLNLVDAGDNAGQLAIADRAIAALQTKHRPAGRLFRDRRPAPAGRRHRSRPLRQHEGSRALELFQDQPARHRHRLLAALSRQPGAAGLRHHQARCRPMRPRPWPTSSPGSRRTPASSSTTVPTRAVRAAISSVAPSTKPTASDPAKFTVDNFTARGRQKPLSTRPGPCFRTSPRRCSTAAPTPAAIPRRCSCSASRPSP